MFGNKVIRFYNSLHISESLPGGVTCMYPFKEQPAKSFVKAFYNKYYSDDAARIYIFGINPGRFGGGVTGIPFTDPVQLQNHCGIENDLPKRQELSAEFVYNLINRAGGPTAFYSKFFVTAVSPIGFIRNRINYNYYDDRELQNFLEPYIEKWMRQQIRFGCDQKHAVCLGTGKNYTYLTRLNGRLGLFDNIIPIEHPRYIMQYKRRLAEQYIREFVNILGSL